MEKRLLVGHQSHFFPRPHHDWLHKPFVADRNFVAHMLRRFVAVTFCMFIFIFVSLMNGAYVNVPAASAPEVGFQAIIVGIVHFLAVYLCYEISVPHHLYIHLNPLITLGDFFFHHTLGFYPCLVQVAAQATGAVAAGGMAYGVITGGTTPFSLQAVDSTISNGASMWWVFGTETTFACLFAWTVWHNYHRKYNTADTMARIVAIASAISFPIASVTVQNPFRWLTACTLSGQCGAPGGWIFAVGPIVGVVLAYLLHLVTWERKKH